MEVQRFPDDFDGVIAGDPATGVPMQVGRALVFQQLLTNPESYVPIEKVEMLSKATVAACDALDGLKDGLVSDPRLCHFKPERLKCAGADAPNCLTAPQLAVVQQFYDGVKLPSGEVYAYPFPFGREGDATGWQAWTIGHASDPGDERHAGVHGEPAERLSPFERDLQDDRGGHLRSELFVAYLQPLAAISHG